MVAKYTESRRIPVGDTAFGRDGEVDGLNLGLYVITWSDPGRGRGHLDVARAAAAGGAHALQLRDKEAGGAEMLRLALEMRDLLEKDASGCLLFVNDRLDVAAASGAHGVHLGQEDLPAAAARPLAGEMILGVSAMTVEQAVKAEAEGADYLGVGPVFPTPSKAEATFQIGIEGLQEIRKAVRVPLVAIGGIGEGDIEQVFEAGADGIAVISAVASAGDMLEAVRRLRRAVDSCLAGR